MQRDILDDAVALVEDAEGRDPLRHRGHPRLVGARRDGGVGDRRLGSILFLAAAAACEGQREQRQGGETLHAYSGIHGW
jgi:hypothetical protein